MKTSLINIAIDTRRVSKAVNDLHSALRDLDIEILDGSEEQASVASSVASDGELHDRLVKDESAYNGAGGWVVETYQVICRRPATNDEIREMLDPK